MFGYWQEIVDFIRALFNSTFKTNLFLERAVMTYRGHERLHEPCGPCHFQLL